MIEAFCEMQQITPKSHADVLAMAKTRRELERQESIRHLATWGTAVAVLFALGALATPFGGLRTILLVFAVLAAVGAMFLSPSNFSIKPVLTATDNDIAPAHQPATDKQLIKLMGAAMADARLGDVVKGWLATDNPIRFEQIEATDRYIRAADMSNQRRGEKQQLEAAHREFMTGEPTRVGVGSLVDDNAEDGEAHPHDHAGAHLPGYAPVAPLLNNAVFDAAQPAP